MRGRLGKVVTVASVATVFMIGGGAPASATPAGTVGVGVALSVTPGGLGHSLTQAASVNVQPAGLVDVAAFQCTALALPDASSTTIEECFVRNKRTGARTNALLTPFSAPGNYAVVAGALITTPGDLYDLCVNSRAQFIESAVGPFSIDPLRVCGLFIGV